MARYPLFVLGLAGGLWITGVSLLAQRRSPELTPVSIHGRVLEENGLPPATLIQVELICSGRLRQQTLTSPDGSFAFDLDQSRNEDWLDPGAGGSVKGTVEGPVRVAPFGRSPNLDEVPNMGRGRVNLSGCEIRAALAPGLTSNVITLSTRGAFDNPEAGVLILRRLSHPGATTVSLNTLKAPKKARQAYDRAQERFSETKPDVKKAVQELQKAVTLYPQFSAAWDLLARAHLSLGDRPRGRECFLRATQEEPGFIPPFLGLAQMAVQEENWSEVAARTDQVLGLDSQQAQALYWNGLANYYLKDFDQSEKRLSSLYNKFQASHYPFGLLPLGVIHANQGRLQEAARELTLYLELMPPEQVPEAQRSELERQLAAWRSQGVAPLRPDSPSPAP